MKWTVTTDVLDEKREVEMIGYDGKEKIEYRVSHDAALISQCLVLILDEIKDLKEKIEPLTDSINSLSEQCDELGVEIFKYRKNTESDLRQNMTEWIRIDKEMPKKDGKYLCWDGRDFDFQYFKDGYFLMMFFPEVIYEIVPFTHWMPLKPPEE